MSDDVAAVVEKIDKRVTEIEDDSRYPNGDTEPEDVQRNAVLALMQQNWQGEITGLKKVRAWLTDES